MKAKLSALLDGEAEVGEVRAVCEALRRQAGLRRDTATYALIGACLRGESGLAVDITPEVMAVLANEPTVLAPSARGLFHIKAGNAALAASVAGALVLLTALLAPVRETGQSSVLAVMQVPASKTRVLAVGNAGGGRLNEADIRQYLIAHEAHSHGSYVGASSQQIRTVSLLDEGMAR